jgi:hypothetical protein
MADVDHPKTHVEDQDVDLPRKQPESPKREGIDPLTESDTMYPAENVKSNAARFNKKEEKEALERREAEDAAVAETVADQKEVDAQANTPNSLLDNTDNGGAAEGSSESTEKTDEEVAKDDGKVETKTVKQQVNEDNQDIEDGDLEDKETGTQNTSPSNKTTDETAQDDVKSAEKKVSSKTPKS